MFRKPPPVVQLLLIANVLIYLIDYSFGGALSNYSAFRVPSSDQFAVFQFITYMFMHANFGHLFGNMIIVYFFGMMLENMWGSERFFKFYFLVGVGAAVLYGGVHFASVKMMESKYLEFQANPTSINFVHFMDDYDQVGFKLENNVNEIRKRLDQNDPTAKDDALVYMDRLYFYKANAQMIGASGAVYGILIGAFIFFGEQKIFLLFPPIPIKIKYLVLFLAGVTFYRIIKTVPGDNVAHLAHLGGFLFGWILIVIMGKPWNRYL